MRKQSLKTLVALITFSVFAAHSANSALPGFGKKKSWPDTVKAEIAKVKDMPDILSRDPGTDQNNDGSIKCSPKLTNCSTINGFASMVRAGCMPRVSQHDSIQKCKINFCMNRCAHSKCSDSDPEELKELCSLHCGEVYLKTSAAQKRLETCFNDKWKLPKPDDYMERLGDWSGKESADWPLTLDQARDFVASTQDAKKEAKETMKQSSGFVKEYKTTYTKTVKQYSKLLKQQDKAHKEVSKLMEMYRTFKADLSATRAKKEEGVKAEKINPDVFDKIERDTISGKLPKGHKGKTLSLPVKEEGLNKLVAEIVADFQLSLGSDLKTVVNAAKEAVGAKQFKAAGKKVLSMVALRKKEVSKTVADEVAEEAEEEDDDEDDDAVKEPAKKSLLERVSVGKKRKRS